jgi:hypothetical protein
MHSGLQLLPFVIWYKTGAMDIKLSRHCRELISQFIQAHPPQTFSSQLRQVLLQYIEYELRMGIYPLWLPEFLAAVGELFEILEVGERKGK